MSAPIFDAVREAGCRADLGPEETAEPDAARVLAAIRQSVEAAATGSAARDAVVLAFDEAANLHDPEMLDQVLADLFPRRLFPFLGRTRRSAVRDAARIAMRGATRPGAVRLAVALLGETGDRTDAEPIETLAVHPALTLHAVTALANLNHLAAQTALLRLLHRTSGPSKVLVIDRLLSIASLPAVRLALLRDALPGLSPEEAAEVAPDIARACDPKSAEADPKAPPDVREGAREVLRAAGR